MNAKSDSKTFDVSSKTAMIFHLTRKRIAHHFSMEDKDRCRSEKERRWRRVIEEKSSRL